MIEEFEQAVLTVDLPEHNVMAGDVGTIVHIHRDGEAYELELFMLDGRTWRVVTVLAGQVRAVTSRDVLHARELTASN